MKAAALHLWHFHCREKHLEDLDTLIESLGYGADPPTREISFWQSLLHPDDLAHWRGRELLPLPDELGEGNGGVEIRLRARDGSWRWMATRARVLETDRAGAPVIVAGTCLDITAGKHAAEQLLHAAQHDALTGLPNRALTYAFGERILEATPRHGGRCAVLFIDLDHFKPINDHYGHAAGDLVLREIARRLQRCVRGEDVVGRLGGDEFVVILAHVQKVEDITHIAADCLAAVGSPIGYRDLELQVSSSIGISLYPADGPDVSTLVKHADTAMYHAKQQGRNNFQFFTHAMNARAKSLLKLEGRMRRALEQEEFSLYYQPVVDTHTHRIIAAEALLRWPAADLAPADFIPLAESSGLIHALGDWVFLQACRQQKVWAQEGLADVSVAINVSPLQFRQPRFAARVANMIAEAGIAATSLQLEITENAFLRDLDDVVQTLNALRALGLRITLDDFGKGYSILNHLKMLPMDAVKVDKDFVHELQLDRKNLAITEAIITLGESLDLQVIAEGIETEAVLQLLRTKRCRHMQGFCLSHPLPAAEFASWVRDPLALERAYQH
jgi:diguanylate cyclase (GGDEF)-like protein